MNWEYCRRCHLLWVKPQLNLGPYLAGGKLRDGGDCDCYFPLTPPLVTPTYLKEYRNHHLANVSASALSALAAAPEWVFIGYSLPSDDVHIRTLLLKARRMRDETGSSTAVTVVTSGRDPGIAMRYGRLFRNATLVEGGFQGYLDAERLPAV